MGGRRGSILKQGLSCRGPWLHSQHTAASGTALEKQEKKEPQDLWARTSNVRGLAYDSVGYVIIFVIGGGYSFEPAAQNAPVTAAAAAAAGCAGKRWIAPKSSGHQFIEARSKSG